MSTSNCHGTEFVPTGTTSRQKAAILIAHSQKKEAKVQRFSLLFRATGSVD
jgi:hypothetical protein